MAGIYNLSIKQGSTFRKLFTWTSDGTPVDLTGCFIQFSIKLGSNATGVYSTTSGHVVITDAPNGKFKLTLPNSLTTTFNTAVKGIYDSSVSFLNGDVIPFLEGNVVISKKV